MTTTEPKDKMVSRSAPIWTWTLLFAIFLLLVIMGWVKGCNKKAEAEKVREAENASTNAPTTTVVVVKKIGKEKTLYKFPPDGCITIFLRGDWTDYPKGGKISFTSLETGKVVLYDEPGVNSSSSLPAGNYLIRKVDPNAWGVEIWQ
ncbi:hypothetical protein A2917_01895 [Candidatus Nomurabacteria bacterium RIFCSPLOWO2_01_FULL_42_17]|uniref:Uncharacterized protein n=1 Tax=Candidatus Nomurabacteria bacterium RIFCSPLOWO2_01_FULL_42_17 TaxID=1801780 RepID=A0A1F6XLC5_9BACT|nr:MAG: hypothetical protein A2917_01895 [Candidatus Nomurabacteria bacterium RIFCSPLOWO2_01_FULL_42_17]